MAKVVMTKRDNCGDYQRAIICKIKGKEELVQEMCEKFLEKTITEKSAVITGETVKVGDMPESKTGVSGLKE